MTPRKQAAAHIRAALKSTFPTTRFVVRRTATTSGCDFYNIKVDWRAFRGQGPTARKRTGLGPRRDRPPSSW